MTQPEFLTIIVDFEDIIIASEITLNETLQQKELFRAKLKFSNLTKLAISDHLIDTTNRKYSFHWMQEDNSLIIRWDNSHYHDDVETAPHHKHVGKDGKAEPSEEMDLRKVLSFISSKITA